MNLTRWSGDTKISEVVDSDLTAAKKESFKFFKWNESQLFLNALTILSFSHLTQTKGNIGTSDLSPKQKLSIGHHFPNGH